MANRKTVTMPETIAGYLADIHTDPDMRAAWLEVAAARMAAHLLRTARAAHGLSQADVATNLGVSQARISQVESGRVEDIPSLEFMVRFLDACGEQLVLSSTPTTQGIAQVRGQAKQADFVGVESATSLASK